MSDLVEGLLAELRLLVTRLDLPPDPEQVVALLEELGWEPGAGLPVEDVAAAVAALGDLAADPPTTLTELAGALAAIGRAVARVRDLRVPDLDGADAAALGADLVQGLLTGHLRERVPAVWSALVLLGLADPGEVATPLVTGDGVVVRREQARGRLRPERLPDLLSRPADTVAGLWWPQGLASGDAADAVAAALLPALADLVEALGGAAVAGFAPDTVFDLGDEGNAAAARTLSLVFAVPLADGATARPGLTLGLLPAGRGGPGVSLTPRGTAAFDVGLGSWRIGVQADGQAPAILVTPAGVAVAPGADAAVRVTVTAARPPVPGAPGLRIGGATGPRVEVGGWALRAFLSVTGDGLDAGGEIELQDVAVVVAAEAGDGFLGAVLPPDGLRVAFSGALGWSRAHGVTVRGSVSPGAGGGAAGLSTDVPLGLELGPVRIDLAHVRLVPVTEPVPGVDLELAASLTVALGPFTATVTRIGLRIGVRARPDGDLGPFTLEAAVAPPTGLGLSLRTETVSGGGFLELDHAAGRYSGVFELTILGLVSVKVIGIVTTRAPDGGPGFALLLIITADGFTPIQLGLGFVLTGIGGLLALNRTVDLEVVRDGLRNGVLDSVLFVDDPVANASTVLRTLDQVFPRAADRLLVGPLVELGWGTPAILRVRLALLLEVPQPIRVILLAALALALPDEKHAVVSVHVDAVGALDLGRGELSLDAALHDSRLWTWVLSGEMALRLNWGDRPGFLLSIGGFHPRFTPPAGIRPLERLSLSLTDGANPRVRFETYLAVTSNSLQMGARVEVYASKAGFGVDGGGAFDGLLRWDPFGLDVSFRAWVRVFAPMPIGDLLAAAVEVAVTGPEPWHVHGSVTVKLLVFSGTATVDFTIGPGAEPRERERVDVASLLRDALARRDAVTAALPAAVEPGAVLALPARERDADPLVVHPMATVAIRQKVVPLGETVSRFGALVPSDGTRTYDLDVAVAGGVAVTGVTDLFPAAQFRDLPDEQRLTAPSFEPKASGVGLGPDAARATPADRAAGSALRFEVLEVLDLDVAGVPQADPVPADATLLGGLAGPAPAPSTRRRPA